MDRDTLAETIFARHAAPYGDAIERRIRELARMEDAS